MIEKAPDAYRTISEVAEDLDLPQHVLRFWETRFSQIKPLKRGGGRRYYRPDDVDLLKGIRHLLYSEGYTIKGVQRILKEQGPKSVMALAHGQAPDFGDPQEDDAGPDEVYEADFEAPAPAGYHPPRPAPSMAPQQLAHRPEPPPVAPAAPPSGYGRPPPPVGDVAPAYYGVPPQPQPAPHAPPPRAADPYAHEMPAEPPPRPVPPPAGPTVSYMRGGLAGAPQLNRKPVIPAPVEPPAPGQTFNVRRAPPVPEPMHAPARFAPLPADEPDHIDGVTLPQSGAPSRQGLSEDSRRALQSALFELTECRRSIERIIAGRDR